MRSAAHVVVSLRNADPEHADEGVTARLRGGAEEHKGGTSSIRMSAHQPARMPGTAPKQRGSEERGRRRGVTAAGRWAPRAPP